MRFLELTVKKIGSTDFTVPKAIMFDYDKISSPIQGVGTTAIALSKFKYSGTHPDTEYVVAEGFSAIEVLLDPSATTNLYSQDKALTLTAGTTQTQAGATTLTAYFNNVSTCANANDGVKLPTAVLDKVVVIVNNGAAACKVWPASGDQVESAAVDAAATATIAAGAKATYWAKDAVTWKLVTPITA